MVIMLEAAVAATILATTHLALVALVVAGQVPEEQIVVVPQQQIQVRAAVAVVLRVQEALAALAALEVAA